MTEESATPDLVELSRQRLEAVNRRDLEAVMSFFAADAVWDMSPIDMGILHSGFKTFRRRPSME
jgi:ketosteroid isomerase-like protein